MPARVTIDDMRYLIRELDALQLEAVPDEQARIVRLQEWLEMSIGVRVAQKTKSRTPAHDELVEAYQIARRQWELAMEHETNLHPAEVAEFREKYPAPTFRAFLVGNRRPGNFCPLCGSDLAERVDTHAEQE